MAGGGRTRFGAVVRGDHPRKLTAAGWRALRAHGIRTVVALRTDGVAEDEPDASPRPGALATRAVAVEDFRDAEFARRYVETRLWGTPLYYRDALERWPERQAAAVAAVANAGPGGVLVHCGVGRDRTGLVSLLLLALSGVEPDAIATDYELTWERMRARGEAEEVAQIQALLAGARTTAREAILALLASLDVAAALRRGGLGDHEVAALRRRLT